MARTSDRRIEHLLRRAGFGARPDELDYYGEMSVGQAVDALINYENIVDDVDDFIGSPATSGPRSAARSCRSRTSPTRASGGCSAWCTATGRCRRR